MTSSSRRRWALAVAVATLLGGCGGPSPSVAPNPQLSSAIRQANQHRKAASGELLYAAAQGDTYIFSYPKVKFVAKITGGGSDVCSDGGGNVFLVSNKAALEFRHGGREPIATLQVPGEALGCAVDPASNSLAVVYRPGSGSDDVAVFADESGMPALYSSNLSSTQFDGYDAGGNLFVAGYTRYGMTLSELPSNGSGFSILTIAPGIRGLPGRIQWDGRYLTVEAGQGEKHPPGGLYIDRLSVSGTTVTVVGSSLIKDLRGPAAASWIDGSSVIIPYGRTPRTLRNIGIWKYPEGGFRAKAYKKPAGAKAFINAVTISVPPNFLSPRMYVLRR